MYIATVIPLSKGIQKENLSYFTNKEIDPGTIVKVPMRSKTIDAIVISVKEALEMKDTIKNASFQMKKIEGVKGPAPFAPSFFQACEIMKDYTASTTGVVLNAMLPKAILEKYDDISKVEIVKKEEKENIKQEKLIFQAFLDDRISWYRTLIREAFAKKESIYICVPTHYDIDYFYEALIKGIDMFVYKFHSDINKKVLIKEYNDCINEEHPVLIIGTGTYLCIPRNDINTIIIERESSEAYKQLERPYLDIRSFAEILAYVKKSKIIFGDTFLRPETLKRHEDGELGEVASPIFRLPTVERQMVVDMKEEMARKENGDFNVLGETTKSMIKYALEHDETVFLFTVRKGLAGITVCKDCGHTLLCDFCNVPVVLYGAKQKSATKEIDKRIFMCNKCGRKSETNTLCPKCESWNLNPLGIGTDRVAEEVMKLFPEANIIQIDKEATSTESEFKKACNIFYKTKGAILIGNEMAFACVKDPVTHSAIISLDGLLSIPNFNITQKVLHIIEKLHQITKRNLIIQTRIPDNPILKFILSGNVLSLFREDLKEREMFGYPPFKRLIKITFRGNARESEKAKSFLEEQFKNYDPQIFSAFVGKVKGEYVINMVLKIDKKVWPFPPKKEPSIEQKEVMNKLYSLPPSFLINVDPEDLL
jgi:primosomal protein N' (replication factor Y)